MGNIQKGHISKRKSCNNTGKDESVHAESEDIFHDITNRKAHSVNCGLWSFLRRNVEDLGARLRLNEPKTRGISPPCCGYFRAS